MVGKLEVILYFRRESQPVTSPSTGLDSGNIGDNFCHDVLNRHECGYDGGDCCQVEMSKK